MFELNLNVKVGEKDGHPVETVVVNVVSMNGVVEGTMTDKFDHVLAAYQFLGDYFYDMMASLVIKAGVKDLAGLDETAQLN
jgi:hypothetical protein